jgi:hypothetical protein
MRWIWLLPAVGVCSWAATGAVQAPDDDGVHATSATHVSSDARAVEGGRDLAKDARFWAELSHLEHDQCTVICYMAACGDYMHWVYYAGEESGQDELDGGARPESDCRAEPCGWYDSRGKHPPCHPHEEQDEEELAILIDAVQLMDEAVNAGDVLLMTRLIEAAPEKFRANVDRSVLQVTPCGGDVIAQYTVPAEDLRSLAEVWARAMATGQ